MASASFTPSREMSLLSLPKPILRPSGVLNTAWMPMPYDSVDLGSSTPLQGMCEV